METYKCEKCGMSVNASCAKCDEPLVNGYITINDGSKVQVSKCPKCEGKIKSPLCCGADMTCSI
ncbi:MAG: hypothetical protein VX499_03065 [Bacteroidota bacterium]|nr:hypothetical protein [Bacteroidota bacterium]|tara:strand:+ start:2201 stop:2392 length:192 start_codon:yes stop_codon:yes gene_type:complete